MQEVRIDRRRALKTVAAASLPLLGAAATRADNKKPKISAPVIGIATNGFNALTNARLAKEFAAQGVKTVQLFLCQSDSNYWRYNNRSDLSTLTADRCRSIANDYRSAGVSIHSMGVYTNLIHPEQAEREANLAYFEDMMKAARTMGVDTLITEAGHFHPKDDHRYHFRGSVWRQMVATGKQLARMAKQHRITVLMEPYFEGFFSSAKRARQFLEAVDSPHVRCLLDPANLLENNDLEEMFAQLTPWIDCLHAKDRKLHSDRGVAAGKGDLDYPKFVALAAKHTPEAPLIMEYVNPDTYKAALAHLRKVIADG
ncbi:MAG: sugar phosphate isomerase/epimerase family protein [Planctomycetota bacterium]|nr:sugar phosphate isomerase/epimerase family protein [Planctomycetota bacterium]